MLKRTPAASASIEAAFLPRHSCTSRVSARVEEAAAWASPFQQPAIDLDRIRDWKNSVIGRLTGGLGGLVRHVRSTTSRVGATFSSPKVSRSSTADGERKRLDFAHAILATGSRPTTIPLFPESQRVIDSTAALDMPDVPGTLLVVGGGYIGLEMASVYASLGTEVSIVEMLPRLLPGADPDLVMPLAKRMRKQCQAIMVDTRVVEAEETEGGIRVRLEGNNATAPEMTFDRVLVSVGRQPNSENLGLENTAVRLDERGFVQVDPQRRTNEPSIFAIGDVIGGSMLAHKATHEGVVAAEAAAGKKSTFDPRAIPAVVFTDPEIAWCGLTAAEAEEKEIPVKVAKFPWAASGRALTLERDDGLTKLIVDPETDRVLGVGITGRPCRGDDYAKRCLPSSWGPPSRIWPSPSIPIPPCPKRSWKPRRSTTVTPPIS